MWLHMRICSNCCYVKHFGVDYWLSHVYLNPDSPEVVTQLLPSVLAETEQTEYIFIETMLKNY